MKITRDFLPDADRYEFDHVLLSKGFLQVDTEQDASYYGNWVNLDTRKACSFAEGDLTIVEFESDAEMADYLRGVYQLLHIDAGLSTRERAMARAREIGIEELMA